MMSLLSRIIQVYDKADQIAGLFLPYVFSGGHNTQFAPSLDFAQGIGAPGSGYDCSAGASACLRAGGLLATPKAVLPLNTLGFASYGLPGVGARLTVWVRNDAVEEHMFLDFHNDPHFRHRFWQAANPHIPMPQVGWINADFTGFIPRHWTGT